MTSSQEDWIYLDEDLPEIHIRELVSIEELLENNPNFVALSDEEIYNQLLLMFQGRGADNEEIARGYLNIHKEITSPVDKIKQYCKHILFQTNAKRKELGTEESEMEYFRILENIKKNPNYKVREQIKNELQEPFEAAEKIEDENKITVPRNRKLQMKLQPNEDTGIADEILRVETDKENYDILSAEFYMANHANKMYIGEHIKTKKIQTLTDSVSKKNTVDISKLKTTDEDITQSTYFDLFTKTVVPSFKYIIKQVNTENTSDLRSLQVLFQLYGRELEDIDTETYNELVSILNTLEYKEHDDEEDKQEEIKKTKTKEKKEKKTNKNKEAKDKEKAKEKKEEGERKVAEKKTAEEKETQQKATEKREEEKKAIKNIKTSYVNIFQLFWGSVIARLKIATDAPMYSEMINNAIALILAKPFKGDIYMPLAKRLENLQNGSVKLEEFIEDIKLLRNLDERNLLSEFRKAVQRLQSDTNSYEKLEEHVKNMERLAGLTIDPNQAEEIFSTKKFIKEYTDPDQLGKGHIQPDVAEDADHPGHFMIDEIDAYVENLPENEDDVEPEEEEDELGMAIAKYSVMTPLLKTLEELSEILTRLRQLTNMPWNPTEFVRMIVQRAPPMIDISGAMYEIDKTIRKDILEKVAEASIDEAITLLPIEQHIAIKNTYHKALRLLREQKATIFYLFLSYWIIHIQALMLEGLFVLKDITVSPCKAELTTVGYPIEEGRDGRKGVLKYIVCILYEEGHDIPNIKEFIDDYSKEQLSDRIKDGLIYFSHEIDTLKKLAYSDISYEGNLAEEEAKQAYDTIIKLRKQTFEARELLKPYIKSLQLLPSIPENVKDRSKHILGCCYTRLDSNYLAANNLSNRLNASKNYFARERIGKKNRPTLMYYGPFMPFIEFEKIEKDSYLKVIGEELEKLEEEKDWREILRDKPFLTTDIKAIIQKENRQEISQLNDEAERYLQALYHTTRMPIDKELWPSIQNMSIQELISLFGQISYDFNLYIEKLKEATIETRQNTVELVYKNEIELILPELQKAKDIIQALKMLDIEEADIGELKAILQLVLCRSLCLPGDVDKNKKTITINKTVKSNFIQNLASYMAKELKKHIELRSTPTVDEIDKKISEIREKRKIETIRQYELNPELNKLVKQAKLQGIRMDIEYAGVEEMDILIPNKGFEDARADLEGALEFQMPTEDPEESNEDRFNDW